MSARSCLATAAVVVPAPPAAQRPAASPDAEGMPVNYRKLGVRIPMRVHRPALRTSRIEVSVLPW